MGYPLDLELSELVGEPGDAIVVRGPEIACLVCMKSRNRSVAAKLS